MGRRDPRARRSVLVFELLSAGGEVGEELLPQGVAMRDAIAADLLQSGHCAVAAATGGCAPPPPHGAQPLMLGAGEDPWDFLARQAREHDAVWVVAPESDAALSRFERAAADSGSIWLGCDAQAIALASSKSRTLQQLQRHGVTTPLSPACEAQATRWVVKPDDGCGALDTRVHASLQAARADLATRTQPACVEPWVAGPALSLSLLCDASGAELLSVNRQLVTTRADGEVSYGGVEIDVLPEPSLDPRFASVCRRVREALPGLRGYVGVDLVLHPTLGPVVIEVNPRVTSSYVGLSRRLRRNVAERVLQEFGLA